jgi:hypothetical protein
MEIDDRKFIFQDMGTREIGFTMADLTSYFLLLLLICKF